MMKTIKPHANVIQMPALQCALAAPAADLPALAAPAAAAVAAGVCFVS